jgi:hypothetical protein
MVSSDSDLNLLGTLVEWAGFRACLVHEQSFSIESLMIYELVAH